MLSQEILDLYKKSRLMTYRAMFGRIRQWEIHASESAYGKPRELLREDLLRWA